MNKYLLSDEAKKRLLLDYVEKHQCIAMDLVDAIAKAQLNHTLEQLEEGEMLVHKPIEHYSRCRNTICGNPNCWCAALREVEGK